VLAIDVVPVVACTDRLAVGSVVGKAEVDEERRKALAREQPAY